VTSSMVVDKKNSLDLVAVNQKLQDASPQRIIQWGLEQFGDKLIATSSFGAQSAIMLHLISEVAPQIPIICVDTGYLFPETYQFADQLATRLKLDVRWYHPQITAARQEATYGKLWDQEEKEMDLYHQINKVEPMQRAIKELSVQAWIAGLRKQQTSHRAGLNIADKQNGIVKIHPILTWTTKDVHEYLVKHDLPYHPLYEKGYASIGDVQLTRPITDKDDERAGRFKGLKQECGIHLPSSIEENDSRLSSNL